MMTTDFNMEDDNAAMSNEIYQHLKKLGLAFPENREEFDYFLVLLNSEMQAAQDLPGPDKILRNGLQTLHGTLNESTDINIEENLAQAAREGGDIPDEVLKQMDLDRQKSEEEQNKNGKTD
jgi:hypothetical protein